MISSVPLSVLFTVGYTATGCYALLRWASLRAGRAGHPGDQVAELSHLLMSLAMVAMTWGYGGTIANLVQIVVFAGFTVYFAARALQARTGQPGGHHCPAAGYHVVMAGSMVWMVASMPLLMGMPLAESGPGGHSHGGHGASGAADAAAAEPTPTPVWALVVTLGFVVALLVATGYWARRAVATAAPAPELVTVGAAGSSVGGAADGVAGADAAHRPVEALTPRTDAVCHLAMSLGMAAMFVAMV